MKCRVRLKVYKGHKRSQRGPVPHPTCLLAPTNGGDVLHREFVHGPIGFLVRLDKKYYRVIWPHQNQHHTNLGLNHFPLAKKVRSMIGWNLPHQMETLVPRSTQCCISACWSRDVPSFALKALVHKDPQKDPKSHLLIIGRSLVITRECSKAFEN